MSRYKLAIPESGERVSHRFDCARNIIIIEVDDGKVIGRQSISTENMNGIQIMRQVINSGAESIICGAMPCFYRRMADSVGIKIMHFSGEMEDAIVAADNIEMLTPSESTRHGHGRRCGANSAPQNRNRCRARCVEQADSVDSQNNRRNEDA